MRKKKRDKLAPDLIENKKIPRQQVDRGPKQWRVSNVHVPLDLDTGKDDITVHDALLDSLATTLDVTTKKLATCDLVIAKKSYDGRRRRTTPPGFTYIVDITEGITVPLKLKQKAGKVQRIDNDKTGCDVAKRLADFAALLSPKKAQHLPIAMAAAEIVVVGAGPAGNALSSSLVENIN